MSPDEWKFFGVVFVAGFVLGVAVAWWFEARRATSNGNESP